MITSQSYSGKASNCELSIFTNQADVIEHISNHILTLPEAKTWVLFHNELAKLIDVDHPNMRYSIACDFWKSPTDSLLQEIYDIYSDSIRNALNEAVDFNFIFSHTEKSKISIDLSGLVVVFSNSSVKTAYYSVDNYEKGVRCTKKSPLPRERDSSTDNCGFAMKAKKRKNTKKVISSEGYKYKIFRKSFIFVRRKIQSSLSSYNGVDKIKVLVFEDSFLYRELDSLDILLKSILKKDEMVYSKNDRINFGKVKKMLKQRKKKKSIFRTKTEIPKIISLLESVYEKMNNHARFIINELQVIKESDKQYINVEVV